MCTVKSVEQGMRVMSALSLSPSDVEQGSFVAVELARLGRFHYTVQIVCRIPTPYKYTKSTPKECRTSKKGV